MTDKPGNEKTSRRKFLKRAALGGAGIAAGGLWAHSYFERRAATPHYPENCGCKVGAAGGGSAHRPNIVFIVADDLGYGDLGCYGGHAIRTPNIDSLAGGGVRFTDFSACDAVCTPSRAGLLTGRYPARMGLDTPEQPTHLPPLKKLIVSLGYTLGEAGLLDLGSAGVSRGIHSCEITLAEALKQHGYRTGMVGKWHLGDFNSDPAFNPVRHGFDSFFGVPYSNDMSPLPIFRGEKKIVEDADLTALTGMYTREAEEFISGAAGKPFFLYFAHTYPHRPMHASKNFLGKSAAGVYGDSVEEIDWSVGRVLSALEKAGVADDTIVMFTSDNGPWYDGSPGGLRGRKGQTFEGGRRVPFICRWPGHTSAGAVCNEPAINLDMFTTSLAAAGVAVPHDREIDGLDITPLLTTPGAHSPHEYMYYYHNGEFEAVRKGKWKYIRDTSHYVWPLPNNKKLGRISNHTTGPLPLLFNLAADPDESYNLADNHPELVKQLDGAMTEWEAKLSRNRLGFSK